MSKETCRIDSTWYKVVALCMLLAMVTLLVARSVHTYVHATHACEHTSTCGDDHDRGDCQICKFELSHCDRVETLEVTFFVTLISTFLFGYISESVSIAILARQSRAPPQPIV